MVPRLAPAPAWFPRRAHPKRSIDRGRFPRVASDRRERLDDDVREKFLVVDAADLRGPAIDIDLLLDLRRPNSR